MSSDNVERRGKNTFSYVLQNPPTGDIAYVHSMRDYARLADTRHTSWNLINRKTWWSTGRYWAETRSNASRAKRAIKPPPFTSAMYIGVPEYCISSREISDTRFVAIFERDGKLQFPRSFRHIFVQPQLNFPLK